MFIVRAYTAKLRFARLREAALAKAEHQAWVNRHERLRSAHKWSDLQRDVIPAKAGIQSF